MIEDYPSDVRRVMGRCIIVRADALYESDAIRYVAVCDDFEVVPHGFDVPEYIVDISDQIRFVKKSTVAKKT